MGILTTKHFKTLKEYRKYRRQLRKLGKFYCYVCNSRTTFTGKHLRQHFVDKHPQCPLRFKTIESKSAVPIKESHLCEICHAEFESLDEILKHYESHPDQYTCDECSLTFKLLVDYGLHLQVHNKDKLYVCQVCNHKTLIRSRFMTHMYGHVLSKSIYKCTLCPKRFKFVRELEEHQNVHTGQRPFICDVCGKDFYASKDMHEHKIRAHSMFKTKNVVLQEEYKCKLCDKTYKLRHSYQSHMAWHTKGPSVCNVCGKILSCSIEMHMKRHEGIKDFACRFCPKKFVERNRLLEHERIHTGEKPFKCQYCGKGFTQRTSRKIHERTHTNERPYICQVCGKGCISRTALNLHLKCCKGGEH